MRRKTTTEFKQEVYGLVGNEYTVLGEYKNERTPIALRHNEDGKLIVEVDESIFKDGK